MARSRNPVVRAWSVIMSLLALSISVAIDCKAEEVFLTDARLLISKAELVKAEAVLQSGLKENPHATEAHYLLGFVYFKQDKPSQSLAEYTLGAAGRRPTAAEFRIVGADYVLLAAFTDADRWFTKATEEAPENPEGWYLLGRTKYNEGKNAEAVAAFEHVLTLQPKDVKAEDNLGLSYKALNQIAEAKAAFETAIAWQKDSPDAKGAPYLNLGELLLDENQPGKASESLLHAVALSPKNPKAHEGLGRAYAALENLPAARLELEKAAELAPKSSAIHYQLGQVYRRLGEKDLARKELELSAHLTSTHSSTETPNVEQAPDSGITPPIAAPVPSPN